MALSAKEFAAWLKQRAAKKDGYLMGGVGEYTKDLTEKDDLITQYSGKQLEKAKYWLKNAERVWDCQGLSDGYVTEMLGKKVNVYARTNYRNWCDIKGEGDIPDKYKMEGAAVYNQPGNYDHITHVGYLVEPVNPEKPEGDWYVVEARGVMYGVVTTRLSQRNWNRWGLMTKYFEYEGYEPKEWELGERVLKKGDAGADVKDLQSDLISLGFDCGSYGADGEFGSATLAAVKAFQTANGLTADGIAGEKTLKKLEELLKEDGDLPEENTEHELPAPSAPAGMVKVTGGSVWLWDGHPDMNGEKKLVVHKGDELPILDARGYIPVVHNGVVKWINSKYAKEI